MRRDLSLLRWAACLAMAAASPILAQEAPPSAPATQQAARQPAAPGEERLPEFGLVTRDMQSISGLFTLYRYRPDDLTKDQSRLLCQIPRSLLRQDLLLATSISRGELAGYQWNDYLVRFEVVGRRVMIVTPDARYVQTPGQPITDAVSRTYNDSFLAGMPIVTLAPNGDPVVDLGSVLMSTTVGLPPMATLTQGGQPRRDLSAFTKVKVFPDNALIDVELAIAGREGRGQNLGISYAFRRLPDPRSYQPRVADERVGYFTVTRQDWNIRHTERENMVRYIQRWDIRKKDPSLDQSPPDKPIVFVIEKSVPLQWRKWVYDGVAEWNQAFERIGIVSAIVVQQQTEDNEFAGADPEDARYNFIRWIVTGRPFAMSPRRADPRTGQILDADIVFDDSFLRSYYRGVDTFGPRAAAMTLGPDLIEFFRKYPAFVPAGQRLEADADQFWPESAAEDGAHGTGCLCAAGMQQQLAFAQLALAAGGAAKKIPDRLIGEAVKAVIIHEVGHAMGLRHNFKASTWLSMEEIKRRRDTSDEPTTASVMDYNPLLYFPGDQPDKIRHFVSPGLGPYDLWAMEYGYRAPGADDGGEKQMLAKIASQNTRRELLYSTDEDTTGLDSPDPTSNRHDMSDDPLAWARMRMELCDSLLKDVRTWAIRKDDPNYYLRQVVGQILSEKGRNMQYVARIVGGQVFNRNRPGDPNARPAFILVDPNRQREALAMLRDTLFSDDFVKLDADLLNDLGPVRWSDWITRAPTRFDYPIHGVIASLQSYGLLQICAPQVLVRLYDAEVKSKADDKFTAAELLSSTRSMIWGNITPADGVKYTNAAPMISSIRRNLQAQHVQYLLALAEMPTGEAMYPDLQNMVRYALRELSEQIGATLTRANTPEGSRIDLASRAHLSEVKSRIDRVLSAVYVANEASAGARQSTGRD